MAVSMATSIGGESSSVIHRSSVIHVITTSTKLKQGHACYTLHPLASTITNGAKYAYPLPTALSEQRHGLTWHDHKNNEYSANKEHAYWFKKNKQRIHQ